MLGGILPLNSKNDLLTQNLGVQILLLDKSGSPPESCVELVQHIMGTCPSLQFSGIMTIGAVARSAQQEETNEDFEVSVFDKIITCRSETVS